MTTSAPLTVLLHGPIESVGINLVSQHLHPDPLKREQVLGRFHCEQNIITLSHIFRSHGVKLAYSGWNEDRAWLEANRDLFDALVISDQSELKSQDVRGEYVFPNNKEKFYYAAMVGLAALQDLCGEHAIALRLRSDVLVRPELVMAEMQRVQARPDLLLIEYLRPNKMLSFPDFLLVAQLGVMHAIYEGMYTRSRAGKAYHLSSHVDHSLTCIGLQQQGRLTSIESMGQALCDSMVWRGLPRYLEPYFTPQPEARGFNAKLSVPPDFSVDGIVANVPAHLSGRPQA